MVSPVFQHTWMKYLGGSSKGKKNLLTERLGFRDSWGFKLIPQCKILYWIVTQWIISHPVNRFHIVPKFKSFRASHKFFNNCSRNQNLIQSLFKKCLFFFFFKALQNPTHGRQSWWCRGYCCRQWSVEFFRLFKSCCCFSEGCGWSTPSPSLKIYFLSSLFCVLLDLLEILKDLTQSLVHGLFVIHSFRLAMVLLSLTVIHHCKLN